MLAGFDANGTYVGCEDMVVIRAEPRAAEPCRQWAVAFPVQILVAGVEFSKEERLPCPLMMVDLAQGRCDRETQVGKRLWR